MYTELAAVSDDPIPTFSLEKGHRFGMRTLMDWPGAVVSKGSSSDSIVFWNYQLFTADLSPLFQKTQRITPKSLECTLEWPCIGGEIPKKIGPAMIFFGIKFLIDRRSVKLLGTKREFFIGTPFIIHSAAASGQRSFI